MRNLTEPNRDGDRATLERALSPYRYGGRDRGYAGTRTEIDEVLALYNAYDAARGVATAPLTAPGLGPNLKQALHDAYDQTQANRRLKHVRQQLFASVDLCPVCGIDPPTELDHVLPRVDYKALSIYVRNLVPLCHQCNHRKLAGFAEPGEMSFVHAYFDLLPDVQFLRALIDLDGDALNVNFVIDVTDVTLGELGGRLTNIHQRLRLNDRYRAEVNLFASSQAVALHLAYDATGAEGVQRYLRALGHTEVARLYRNHWRPTLWYALAEHADFCDGGFASVFPVPEHLLSDIRG